MEKKTVNIWVVYLVGIVVICGFTVGGYFIGTGQSVDEIDRLNRKYDNLAREYADRQRKIEDGIDRCLGIVERTETNTSGAISNLRTAVDLIKQGIEENKALKSELSRIRTDLYGDRDMDRIDVKLD